MAKGKRYPLGTFLKRFSTEEQCREYLAALWWKEGYVCPKCGCRHTYRMSNGRYQRAQCRHQVSVTAGTVLHKTHMPLTQWFLAFYLACQDKRGISAAQLSCQLGTTYKTAWYMLKRIRAAMGQRDKKHLLSGVIFLFWWTDGGTKTWTRHRKSEGFCGVISERIRQPALSQDDGRSEHLTGICQKIRPIRVCRGKHGAQRRLPQLHSGAGGLHP